MRYKLHAVAPNENTPRDHFFEANNRRDAEDLAKRGGYTLVEEYSNLVPPEGVKPLGLGWLWIIGFILLPVLLAMATDNVVIRAFGAIVSLALVLTFWLARSKQLDE